MLGSSGRVVRTTVAAPKPFAHFTMHVFPLRPTLYTAVEDPTPQIFLCRGIIPIGRWHEEPKQLAVLPVLFLASFQRCAFTEICRCVRVKAPHAFAETKNEMQGRGGALFPRTNSFVVKCGVSMRRSLAF